MIKGWFVKLCWCYFLWCLGHTFECMWLTTSFHPFEKLPCVTTPSWGCAHESGRRGSVSCDVTNGCFPELRILANTFCSSRARRGLRLLVRACRQPYLLYDQCQEHDVLLTTGKAHLRPLRKILSLNSTRRLEAEYTEGKDVTTQAWFQQGSTNSSH